MSPDLPQGFWLDTVDSTMDEAKRLIQAGHIQGTAFVVANHQTKGRGTQGRAWSSPSERGMYLSIVHLPSESDHYEPTSLYTLAAGVACVEAIHKVTGLETSLKPINDIYSDGKKLGGVLIESEFRHEGFSSLITGIGINVRQAQHDLDHPVVVPVSLQELLPPDQFGKLSLESLIETVVAKVCFWYALLFHGQRGQVQRAWERYRLPDTEIPKGLLF